MDHDETPMFSRSAAVADTKELRGLAPTPLVQALDALSICAGMDRTAYVNKVLDAHVRVEAHRAMMLERMLRGNPYITDGAGVPTE